ESKCKTAHDAAIQVASQLSAFLEKNGTNSYASGVTAFVWPKILATLSSDSDFAGSDIIEGIKAESAAARLSVRTAANAEAGSQPHNCNGVFAGTEADTPANVVGHRKKSKKKRRIMKAHHEKI